MPVLSLPLTQHQYDSLAAIASAAQDRITDVAETFIMDGIERWSKEDEDEDDAPEPNVFWGELFFEGPHGPVLSIGRIVAITFGNIQFVKLDQPPKKMATLVPITSVTLMNFMSEEEARERLAMRMQERDEAMTDIVEESDDQS